MAVDQSTGKMFVFDGGLQTGQPGYASLLRFPPNASGNETPFARSPQLISPASELANDSTGANIIANYYSGVLFDLAGVGISTIEKRHYNNTVPAYPYGIGVFLSGGGVADDPATKTYVATGKPVGADNAGIYRFAEKTTGAFSFDGSPTTLAPSVVSVITSDTCGNQLTFGYPRNIYVVHSKQIIAPAMHPERPGDETQFAIRHLRRTVSHG